MALWHRSATTGPPDAGEDAARRELLLAAIADLQDSIKANDQKASAALIIHGLLFAGVVAVVTSLPSDPIHRLAGDTVTLGRWLLVAAFLLFAVSVVALVVAIVPYRPRRVDDALISGRHYERVFFPERDALSDPVRELSRLTRVVAGMRARDLERELGAEVLKLADVLAWESRWTRRGYWLLVAELAPVGAFLALALFKLV